MRNDPDQVLHPIFVNIKLPGPSPVGTNLESKTKMTDSNAEELTPMLAAILATFTAPL
jgi:hypothetical protein